LETDLRDHLQPSVNSNSAESIPYRVADIIMSAKPEPQGEKAENVLQGADFAQVNRSEET
jgi:hypothetical protein